MGFFSFDRRIDPVAPPWGYMCGKYFEHFPRRLTCFPPPTILPGTYVIAETPVSDGEELTCLSMPSISPGTLAESRVFYNANGADAPVNCISGGVATVSYQYSSYGPANALDGNTGSYWRTGSTNQWFKYDYGEGVTKTVRQFKVYLSSYSPMGFIFQGSNNDSDWDNLRRDTFANGGGWQTFAFPNDTAYRYYRLYIVDSYGSRAYVYEIEMAESCEEAPDEWTTIGATYAVLGNDSFGFVRSGYAFTCWNTEADGSGTDYDDTDNWELTGEPVMLYAKWTEEE